MDFYSEEVRRNPFPVYSKIRSLSPVICEPQSGLWMVFNYDGVKRVLNDHEAFSSRHGPEWLVFMDSPRHTKLRALISQAFTSRSIAGLEDRIRTITRELLDHATAKSEMDLADELSTPLPMTIIAEMIGIPASDRARFKCWGDVILNMSYTIPGGEGAAESAASFRAITIEMSGYLAELVEQRKSAPQDDLLTRLIEAQVDGDRLTHQDILGFFQLLLIAGSETTTNLINNAIICFIEHPEQLARLQAAPELLPVAIEEVLRFRSPVQWMFRVSRTDVELCGQTIPAGKLVLPMIGSANRDPELFPDSDRFDIGRNPNPHIAFGHGIHFCMGAALARLESKIALTEFLSRIKKFELASAEPWEPRKALHVHGPNHLPIRFELN